MFIEKLNNPTIKDIYELYPNIYNYRNLFLGDIDTPLLVFSNYIDHSNSILVILNEKYGDGARFRKARYKENPYLYNSFCYVLDVKEWNIPCLKEFVNEFSKLKNISMKPNLFVIFNFEEMDRDTQNSIGICIEVNIKYSRFWLFVGNSNWVSQKVKNRTFYVNIRRPSDTHMKRICHKIIDEQLQTSKNNTALNSLKKYDIILDKLIATSHSDYGKLFLKMDIFIFNPDVLNSVPFKNEKENIRQFFINKEYLTKNYPKLREICFNLFEKFELSFIIKEIFNSLSDLFSNEQKCTLLNLIADYQCSAYVPNKQVWILETWLLEAINIYYSPTLQTVNNL